MDVGQADYVRLFDDVAYLTRRPAYAEPFHHFLSMPSWIDHTSLCCPDDIIAVIQGGCESGAYMPAVTYHVASETMSGYGDAVLTFLQDNGYMEPEFAPPADSSWSSIAVYYLSLAVEVWCRHAMGELCEIANGDSAWRRWL